MSRGDAASNVGGMNQAAALGRIGPLLRDWRRRRRMSQLDLALSGTAVEVTASELSIESFFPADRTTADVVWSAAAALDPRARDA